MATPPKGKQAGLFGGLGVIGAAFLKFNAAILGALKGLAFLKYAWFFKSFLSMFISIGFYAMFWGWPYAVAVVLLLLIHEMGHWIWMKACGYEPNAPMFVPGLGAYVAMTKLPPDEANRAWVAFAGPLIGGIGSAVLFWSGVLTQIPWLMGAGSTGFMLNLFQLIPAKPFDGGFVIQAVSRWLLIPGTALLIALAILCHSVLLLIISAVSVFSLLFQKFRRGEKTLETSSPLEAGDLIPATKPQRLLIAFAYISLAGMLGYLYWLTTNELVSFLPPHSQ